MSRPRPPSRAPSSGPDPLEAQGPADPSQTGPLDVLVLGGGAAGLWVAGTAAQAGLRVLVLEKNRRVGVKILASGGGACNLTTTLPPLEAARWFRPQGERFLRTAFRLLSPQALVERFAALGVPTESQPALEKVWPVSRRAHDVALALLARARAAGARVHTLTPALDVSHDAQGFTISTPYGAMRAPHVVVATGGKSYPRTGTTGDAYGWLAALGHTIVPLAPALVPLLVEAAWVRALTGLAVPVEARVLDARGHLCFVRRRPLLFTHLGLSGPAAMDVSRFFSASEPEIHRSAAVQPAPDVAEGAHRLVLDFVVDRSDAEVAADLARAQEQAPERSIASALPAELPERLRRALAAQAGVDADAPRSALTRARRHALVQALKRLEIAVRGTRGFEHAEVTAGGVDLSEVDPGTMASLLVPGLYVVGEVLDVDGPIGGFSFQAAFATAEVAGRALGRLAEARPSPDG